MRQWRSFSFVSLFTASPLSLLPISICMLCGVLAAVYCRFSMLIPALVALTLWFIAAVYWRSRYWLVAWLWFVFGVVWTVAYGQYALSRWLPEDQEGSALVLSGHLVDFPRASSDAWQFDFYVDELAGVVRLSLPFAVTEQKPDFSCRYQIKAKLRRPRGLLNNGQYDYQAWLLQAQYLATGYIQAVDACTNIEPGLVLRGRSYIDNWINTIPLSQQAAATLSALLIGNYAGIDAAQWQVLRDSGTIHLLSVSGLHIALVAMIFYGLSNLFVRLMVFPLRYWPASYWASVVALVFAVFYALMAGFSVATQRSLIMIVIAVLQRLIYGRFRFSLIFFLSLILVLLPNPLVVTSASFWFTYMATGILMLSSVTKTSISLRPWAYKINDWLLQPMRLQWQVFLLMMPVLLFVYGRVSWLSLPVNFLAVPWVSFVSLPLGFAALAALPFSSYCAEQLLRISAGSIDIYWWFMQQVLQIADGTEIVMGGLALSQLLLAVLGLGIFCFAPQFFPMRYSALLLCLPAVFLRGLNLPENTADIHVLDVGQGLSVMVRTENHALVYDAGDRRSERFDAGRDLVAAALRNQRVARMDQLIISHADRDHAGGSEGLLSEISAQQLWSGTPELMPQERVYLPCHQGMHWRWDGVDFRVLSPVLLGTDEVRVKEKNNHSCVLLIEAAGKRMLLTGDIEKPVEQMLLQQGTDVRADVLLAAHHGSKTSSSDSFLQAVNAGVVVVSAGFRNQFHHPAQEVVKRYQQCVIPMFNTAELGAIYIRLSAAGVQISNALCSQGYFWQWSRYNAHCLSDDAMP